jgi:ADP-ribose pyrophosphatase YjhB (NUDIX family)
METLMEISNADVGEESKKTAFTIREAARAVMFDGGKVALLFVSAQNYHKLPGGGLEGGESVEDALRRELLEETGCKARVTGDIGMIVERRESSGMLQKSYCFLAKVTEKVGEPRFDSGEIGDGFKLVWMGLDDAIAAVERARPSIYTGKFIVKRDAAFLRKAKELLARNH